MEEVLLGYIGDGLIINKVLKRVDDMLYYPTGYLIVMTPGGGGIAINARAEDDTIQLSLFEFDSAPEGYVMAEGPTRAMAGRHLQGINRITNMQGFADGVDVVTSAVEGVGLFRFEVGASMVMCYKIEMTELI